MMEALWFMRLFGRSQEPLGKLSAGEFLSLLRPKAKEIVTAPELEVLLKKKKKLKVKLGVDPTGAELHLGHTMPLVFLRLFQRAGHEVHFVIGDFTAQIGDPSGRTDKRVELIRRDVIKNMKSYVRQIAPLINLKKAKVHHNSRWLARMPLGEFLKVTGAVSFGEVAQREDFRARIKSGTGVSLREANYSSLMAIDSLELCPDIEVGGVDQLLNFMQTREIMSAFGKKPEVILATPMLEGTAGDGRKMSKSFKNYIALSAKPEDQFGLIMSIPDKLLLSYFTSFGDVFEEEISELDSYISAHPLEAKKELGMLVVALFYGEKEARDAREGFERKFSSKTYQKADEINVSLALPSPLLDSLVQAFRGRESKTKIRTLIRQGAVRRIRGGASETLSDEAASVEDGDLIKAGKLHLLRFKNK